MEVIKALGSNIPKHAPNELTNLCKEYADVFALPTDPHTVNNFYSQKLVLNDYSPVYVKNYRYPHSQKAEIDSQVKHMLQNNIIQPSTSN